jgi:hypothetical protein
VCFDKIPCYLLCLWFFSLCYDVRRIKPKPSCILHVSKICFFSVADFSYLGTKGTHT